MIGRTLDHYRIESKLGEGGMGVVYKAQDIHLGRPVAIKVLPPDKVADPGRKQRFVQEAKAASALNHPNIVTVYDSRSVDDSDFIVLEYIQGKTLEELVPPKGLQPAQAVLYAAQIADALAKAHGAGILHRDLKPSNIMVTDEGRVKVLDFGLAKLLEPAEISPDAATRTMRDLTEEGAVVGTAAYMSPEQAEGKPLDARSDIFSFGSVLYQMLTGRRPFTGNSRLSILSRILNEDPAPPARTGASIPVELEKIVLRCLRKDPARRYQTMADLKVALDDVAEESGSGRPAPRTPLRVRWAGVALAVAAVAAGFFFWRSTRADPSTEPLRAVPLTTSSGVKGYPSFSPDGEHVAFTWSGPKHDNPEIYIQQIGAGAPFQLTHDPGNDYNPVWSPDGRSIAFLRSQSEAGKSELRLIPPLGGAERKLAEIRVRSGFQLTPPYVGWCPKAECLVITDSPGEGKPDALFVLSIDTGEKRQLTNPQRPTLGDTNPAISPDGRWLAFRRMGALYNSELYLLPLGTGYTPAGDPRRLTAANMDAGYATWMSGSQEILFSAQRALWRLPVIGEHTPARLPFVGEDGVMPAVSREQPGRPNRLVYIRSFTDVNIWRIDTPAPGAAAPSPPVMAISSTRMEGMPQLSMDGRRVTFWSDRSGENEIWVSDPDGSNAQQLTFFENAPGTGYPHWSPDGQWIAFHSSVDGQPDIFLIAAGGGKPRNLTSRPGMDAFPSFSHDGKWIYFSSNRSGEPRIWKMATGGGDAAPVTNTIGFAPLESSDGAYVYYVQTLDAPSALWRVPSAGGSPEKVLEGVFLANYAVLEGGIYYIAQPSGQGGVYYLDRATSETRLEYFDFATRKSTTVERNLGTVDTPIAVSREGRTILFPRLDSSVDDLMLVERFR